ncbi:MAG: Glu/Leu/Phe/Val dehydrogenase [Cyclobacteriaceae bacterium]
MIGVKEAVKPSSIEVFEEVARLEHEQIVYCYDAPTGLKAIIGIHNTVLGPALGGTRMWNYASEQEALVDVLRLSRGMTFKAAISGLNLGGGKAVIIGDVSKLKSEALLRRFGRFIESLGGKYITAEDVNMSPNDMEYISMETRHVSGLSENLGGGGDPSPVTAYGVYMGMKAAAKKIFGHDSLAGKSIAVQGVGHVGMHLVELLANDGAKIYVNDIYESRIKEAVDRFKAIAIGVEEIYDLDADIYAPCALGATINDQTIERLKYKIIAGAANNQLQDESYHGDVLKQKDIVFAPDFLINAGGLINVGIDYLGGWSRDRVYRKTEQIYQTTLDILKLSEKEGINTQSAAIRFAMKRIREVGQVKSSL